jgi:hypothetical protein
VRGLRYCRCVEGAFVEKYNIFLSIFARNIGHGGGRRNEPRTVRHGFGTRISSIYTNWVLLSFQAAWPGAHHPGRSALLVCLLRCSFGAGSLVFRWRADDERMISGSSAGQEAKERPKCKRVALLKATSAPLRIGSPKSARGLRGLAHSKSLADHRALLRMSCFRIASVQSTMRQPICGPFDHKAGVMGYCHCDAAREADARARIVEALNLLGQMAEQERATLELCLYGGTA